MFFEQMAVETNYEFLEFLACEIEILQISQGAQFEYNQ